VLALLDDYAQQHQEDKRDRWLSVFDLTDAMTPADQDHLSRTLIDSVRRAVKKLAAKGEVETRLRTDYSTDQRNGCYSRVG
jgi:hypothetical protein